MSAEQTGHALTEPLQLEHVLGVAADRFGDRCALIGDARKVTYTELEALALGCAAQLRARGVQPGDAVVVLVANSVSYVAALFGALMTGAVVATLSPDSTARELEAMVTTIGPRAAVVARGGEGRDVASELDHVLPSARIEVQDADEPGWPTSTDRSLVVKRDPDSPAFVAFTSGSTGQPKGAVHRAVTLMHTGRFYLDLVARCAAMTTVATFPLYHLGGLTLVLLPTLLGGGTVVMMDGFTVPEFVEAVERHRADHVAAIPAMLELLFLRANVAEHDLSSLRWVMLSGAPVTNQLARQVHERLGVTVFVGYGQTECPGTNVMTRKDTSVEDVGPMVGWPVEGYEVAILDHDGRPCPDGEIGEVCVRSHYQMLGYLGNPEATQTAIDQDGWLHMGDLGVLRPDGALEIRGRKKEMYIRGGFNVYPVEVEAALLEHPDVSIAAVHPISDEVLGERGVAWVVPEAGRSIDPDDLRAFVGKTLAYYKLPDVVRVVAELPMNAVGKVDKRALRSRMAEGDDAADGP
ncbi:MAG: AMP-binding protein [Propionibacteriales bacterium]|nr:AMP-binding protein [Propionibacteriales bacterium]